MTQLLTNIMLYDASGSGWYSIGITRIVEAVIRCIGTRVIVSLPYRRCISSLPLLHIRTIAC
jgi:hypothetical protein